MGASVIINIVNKKPGTKIGFLAWCKNNLVSQHESIHDTRHTWYYIIGRGNLFHGISFLVSFSFLHYQFMSKYPLCWNTFDLVIIDCMSPGPEKDRYWLDLWFVPSFFPVLSGFWMQQGPQSSTRIIPPHPTPRLSRKKLNLIYCDCKYKHSGCLSNVSLIELESEMLVFWREKNWNLRQNF